MTMNFDELARLKRLFAQGVKPLPKFRRVLHEAELIDERFGRYGEGFIDIERLIRIHERITAAKTVAVVEPDEIRWLGRLVFLDIDEAHKALDEPRYVSDAIRRVLVEANGGLARTFLRSYASSETAARPQAAVVEGVRTVAALTPDAAPLAASGLLTTDPAGEAAAALKGEGVTADGLLELSGGWFRKSSPLTREVWRRRLAEHRARIAAAMGGRGLSEALSTIVGDSTGPDGALLWPRFARDLAHSILGPYADDKGYLPPEHEQRLLTDAMVRLFGDPRDPEARWRWADIEDEFKALIRHWLLGRQLNSTLEMVKALTGSGKVEARQWDDRERFWKAYWRAGRVTSCKIYIQDRMKATPGWRAVNARFHGKCDYSGTLTGIGSREQVIMMIRIDEDILAVEVNFNGSLRIGSSVNEKRVSQNIRLDVYGRRIVPIGPWLDTVNYSKQVVPWGKAFPHLGPWQNSASDLIHTLSGLAVPNGARC